MASYQFNAIPKLTTREIKKFWGHIDKTPGQGPNGDCWGWKSRKSRKSPKPALRIRGKRMRASRIAYFIQFGKDPGHLFVCHSCDNPPCNNGEHFFLGTDADNKADMYKKHRLPTGDNHWSRRFPEKVIRGDQHRWHYDLESRNYGDKNGMRKHPEKVVRGERQHLAKLTTAKVKTIRKEYATGKVLQKTLAKKYGVSLMTICRAVNRQTWAHVN